MISYFLSYSRNETRLVRRITYDPANVASRWPRAVCVYSCTLSIGIQNYFPESETPNLALNHSS